MFTINFFGTQTQALSVNSNGAISIGNLWPIDFRQLAQSSQNRVVLSPFFANVDNRYAGAIQWGLDEIDGHQVMGAQWLNVVAYDNLGKTNSFQIIITDRSDVEDGAFDFEFNYDSITWDVSASGWWDTNPSPAVARVGWHSNYSGETFEFAGSGITGTLLDSNLVTGLIHNSRNSDVDGRYIFQVRNGQVLPENVDPSTTPPAVPSGLSVVSEDAQIALSWDSVSNATSYKVKRSLISGGPYGVVDVSSGTNAVDSGLTNGTFYYYVVSALGDGGESAESTETNAIPSAAIVPEEYTIDAHAFSGGTNLSLAVSNSVLGHLYQLLATDSLTPPDWQPAGIAAIGNGSNMLFSIPIAGAQANRYFKLNVQRQ
jgi:hypothetical protein